MYLVIVEPNFGTKRAEVNMVKIFIAVTLSRANARLTAYRRMVTTGSGQRNSE